LGLVSKCQIGYEKIDLIVVYMANLINVIMTVLFIARISGLPQVEYVLGIVVMIVGFALGYIAFFNRKNKRDKWDAYLLSRFFYFSSSTSFPTIFYRLISVALQSSDRMFCFISSGSGGLSDIALGLARSGDL
jgi:small-conductance mechanosensitive channel